MALTPGLTNIERVLTARQTRCAEQVVKFSRDLSVSYGLLAACDAAVDAAASHGAISQVLELLAGWRPGATAWSIDDLEAWIVSELLRNLTRGTGFGGSLATSSSPSARAAVAATARAWATLLDGVKYGRLR